MRDDHGSLANNRFIEPCVLVSAGFIAAHLAPMEVDKSFVDAVRKKSDEAKRLALQLFPDWKIQ